MRIIIEDKPTAALPSSAEAAGWPASEPPTEALDGGAAGGSLPGTGAAGDDVGAPPAWLLDAINAAMNGSTQRSGDAPAADGGDGTAADPDFDGVGEDAGAGPA